MKRYLIVAVATVTTVFGLVGIAGPIDAAASAPNGRIVFTRYDMRLGGVVSYTMDPDGSHVQQVFSSGHSEWPHWSPDGSQITIFCCDDGMIAHIVDVDTGSFREIASSDPTLENHCGFAWSPDGSRLACSGFGLTDPSRNGIYTIRSSDGLDLMQVTSDPGGEDNPGDFSPDGRRIVFERNSPEGRPVGIFVVKVNGGGIRRLTPRGMILDWFGGSWSPSGDHILFVAQADQDHQNAIWEVDADGSGLHQLPITPACGGSFSDPHSIGCRWPGWSPDGTKIVFTRVTARGILSNICIVNADGTGLVQVTNTGDADQADWGTHPLAG
jgi:Tol biopolymer transport system component